MVRRLIDAITVHDNIDHVYRYTTHGAVRAQFLAEAMTISLGGGVLGIVLGVIGARLAARISALPVQLDAPVILLATTFAVATGLFFGYYPARKASTLNPIEALRQ